MPPNCAAGSCPISLIFISWLTRIDLNVRELVLRNVSNLDFFFPEVPSKFSCYTKLMIICCAKRPLLENFRVLADTSSVFWKSFMFSFATLLFFCVPHLLIFAAVPGRDACEIAMVHQEDAGLNVEVAKIAFAKGIWSYVCKMDSALRKYSTALCSKRSPLLTSLKFIQKVSSFLITICMHLFIYYLARKGNRSQKLFSS